MDEVFHYTTNQALINIIKSKSIWLSDARFLNDREEIIFSQSLVRVAASKLEIQNWLDKLKTKGAPDFKIEVFRTQYEKFLGGRMGPQFETNPNHIGTPYVFCLSGDRDSLAQWRGYGNQEVCIGFSKNFFEKSFTGLDAFAKVKYYAKEHFIPELETQIKEMIDRSAEKLIRGGSETLYLKDFPSNFPVFIKHLGFQSENEWRAIKRQSQTGLLEEAYFLRAGSGVPVPTIAKAIDPLVDIVSITFGPGSDQGMVNSLREVLSSNPNCSWKIGRSEIPYRA